MLSWALPTGQLVSRSTIFQTVSLYLQRFTSAASTSFLGSFEFSGLANLHSRHSFCSWRRTREGLKGSRRSPALLEAERVRWGKPGRGDRRLGAAAGSGCRATERTRWPRRENRHTGRQQEGSESEVPLESFYLAPNSEPSLFVSPWTVARQAPLYMGFSRPEYWSGLPFPSPGDLSDPRIEPESSALAFGDRHVKRYLGLNEVLKVESQSFWHPDKKRHQQPLSLSVFAQRKGHVRTE